MRMWGINPKLMCRKHLLGEHVEMHMMIGTLQRKKSIRGFLDKNLMEIHNINRRHGKLVKEMLRRKMNHKSPLPKFKLFKAGKIDKKANLLELAKRCKECRNIQLKAIKTTHF